MSPVRVIAENDKFAENMQKLGNNNEKSLKFELRHEIESKR